MHCVLFMYMRLVCIFIYDIICMMFRESLIVSIFRCSIHLSSFIAHFEKKCILMKYKKLYFSEDVVVKCRRHELNGCLDVG